MRRRQTSGLRFLSKENLIKQSSMIGLLFAVLLLSGCGIDKNSDPNFVASNIQILYDRDAIAEKEEAVVYSAIYYQADSSSLREYLLQYEIVENELNAFGRSFYTKEANSGSEESLVVYDGGAEFGVRSGVYGGFNYSLWTVSRKDYQSVVSMEPGHPDNVTQIFGNTSREDFAVDGDLDFMMADEAVEMLETMAAECGLPEMQVENIYSLDAETLQEHGRIASMSDVWEKSDEAYILHLTQMIDGIPVMNHLWNDDVLRGGVGATYFRGIGMVSEDGIISFNVTYAVEITGASEQQKLLSSEAAEEILQARYEDAVYFSNVCAETLALKYVIQHDGNQLKLTPAWVFCISRDFITENPDSGEPVYVKKYEHCVINAVTGELIKSGEVQK